MNVALAYICVSNGGQKTYDYAARFVGSYLQFKPGIEHQTFIVCNGGLPTDETQMLFLPLENCVLYPRLNDKGWDISAYQDVARKVKCDLLICLGESVYFHREGWGKRLVEAAEQFGEGIYGIWATNLVRGHIITTGFACSPQFLVEYPRPNSRQERYEFEHGTTAMWRRILAKRKAARLVTWDGSWDHESWRKPSNILWRGDQSNCLAWCNHSDRYKDGDNGRKIKWAQQADRLFR